MAGYQTVNGVDKKRKAKKRKARTDVSSSSDTDSESEASSKTSPEVEEAVNATNPIEFTPPPPREKKQPKKSKFTSTPPAIPSTDTITTDDIVTASPPLPTVSAPRSNSVTQVQDDFNAMYLRKITAELADELDKVREASDFKASSVPMLVHALKQGGGLFSAEERRKVVGAGKD